MSRIFATLSAAFAMLTVVLSIGSAAELHRWQGEHSTVQEPKTVVATTQSEWNALWSAVSTPAPDGFDEKRQTGVGIFLGRRGAEGFGVRVVSMGPRDGKFVIEIEETGPGSSAVSGGAAATPWLMLLIDRPDLPIAIEPRFRTQ
jgi:hypothetical protein